MLVALSAFSTLPCALSASFASASRRARYALAERRLLPPPHPSRSAHANTNITPAKRLRQRMTEAYAPARDRGKTANSILGFKRRGWDEVAMASRRKTRRE